MKLLPIVFLSTVSALLVPPPTGPYSVALKVQALADATRPADPLRNASDGIHTRRVLISVFLPVDTRGKRCPPVTVPYMTPKVAAVYGQQAAEAGLSQDVFASFDMQFCDLAKLSACGGKTGRNTKRYPVVLFTPGLAESRLLYSAGARSLASEGYIVVTVDHPFEPDFVEFPDGSVVAGGNIADDDEALKSKLVEVRTRDLSFVVDQLHNKTLVRALLANYPGSMDLGRIVVFAHSIGGGAAATLARDDRRVLGGVDLDGQIVEPVRSQGLDKSFLLAGRYGHSAANSSDPTWNQFWPHLAGPRVEVAINGTTHGSYTDRPLLVSALGLPDSVLDQVAGLIGSIKGRRLEQVVNSVLMAFFDFTFYRKTEGLKQLPRVLSEVSITRSKL